MRHDLKILLIALPAVTGGVAYAEESWLDTEIRAQEARWEARQDKITALQPPLAWPAPAKARALRERERRVSFPALANVPAPRLLSAPAASRAPASTAPKSVPDGRRDGIGDLILASAQRHGIDPLLIRAVILAESAGHRRATSPKGAMGLMQLMPATARRFGVADPYDPEQNVGGGAAYLRWLLDRFDGDATLALAGYNAGEGAVDRYGGVPPYRETRNYVKIVQSNHRFLRRQVVERVAERAR